MQSASYNGLLRYEYMVFKNTEGHPPPLHSDFITERSDDDSRIPDRHGQRAQLS